jgi:uncharacterized membrane protein
MKRDWVVPLVLATFAGAMLRLTLLGHQSFWYDEAVSSRLAQAGLDDILSGRARDLGNPPFHLIFLHGWEKLFGLSDAALRASSAVVSVLSIPLMFSVGRRLLGERVALYATTIFALSPVQIYFAQETRTYALVTLICLLSTDLLLRALDEPRRFWLWASYTATVFLAMYSHYFAAFLILAQIGFVLLTRREQGIILRLGGALVAAGLLYLVLWVPSLVAQASTKGNLGRSADTWYLHVAATPLVFGVGTTLVWKGDVGAARLALAALALAAFGGAAAFGAWSLRHKRGPLTLLLLWFLFPIVLPVLVSVTLFPLYSVRYGLIAAPAYYLLIAVGLSELRATTRTAVAGAMALTAAVSLGFYFTRMVKLDWRAVAAYVSPRLQPGDVLAFDADFNETAFAHYAGPDPSRIRLLPPRSERDHFLGSSSAHEPPHSVDDRLESARRVWFIFSDPSKGAGDYYQKAFAGWHPLDERDFRGVEVHLYDAYALK